jgi:hypothetical protein
MDLFVVPTISFRLLYGLLILRHGRRQILWLNVTAHPTSEWIARQLTEACGWDGTPEYLIRDHDSVYGAIFTRRVRAMGIRDRPIAPRSPWQNGHAERLIGSPNAEVRLLTSQWRHNVSWPVQVRLCEPLELHELTAGSIFTGPPLYVCA